MAFYCRLDGPERVSTAGRVADEAEFLDSNDVVIMGACALLGETDARFRVGGFGAEDWNLDVRYDMSVFLEQLPGMLRGLNAGGEGEIAMYSQGVERVLTFHTRGDEVRIECVSGTAWVPDPAEEILPKQELVAMLTSLARDFACAVSELDNDAARLEPIQSWLRGELA